MSELKLGLIHVGLKFSLVSESLTIFIPVSMIYLGDKLYSNHACCFYILDLILTVQTAYLKLALRFALLKWI